MSHAIIDLPRIKPANRLPNDNLVILLNRKLRAKLFNNEGTHFCPCGAIMDKYWDHAFSCTKFNKIPMHHSIRDCLFENFKTLLPQVKLVDSPSMVLREPKDIVDGLPELRPFDVSFIPGHTASDSKWTTRLSQVGIDVTVINPFLKPARLPTSLAARKNDINLRHREGERQKFQRDGATDKTTRITLSGECIIKNINSKNMALVPMTVLPGGSTGGLINKMLYGTNAIPLNKGDFDNKRHAAAAALTARSKVPSGILIRADDIWRHSKQTIPSHIQQLYTPKATFDRQLGLTIATAFSNHILRAHKKVTKWTHRHPDPPLWSLLTITIGSMKTKRCARIPTLTLI